MTLVAFDFDGTLSDSEMTVLLGEEYGVADRMAAITEQAMNDEIGYAESLRERAALLEGLPETSAEKAWDRVILRDGAGDVIQALNEAGVETAILTGGFDAGVARALERAGVGVDHIIANHLPLADLSEIGSEPSNAGDQRQLTGGVEGPLIEGTKDEALGELAGKLGIPMDQTVAVGDGANDMPMLKVAGLAVGFSPKPAVEPHCDVIVHSMSELHDLLRDHGLFGE